MPFYEYPQNNTGGNFHIDEDAGISVHVIVEADTALEANRKAKEIGLYFDGYGDCLCCGNRWHGQWDGDEGDKVPSIYGEPVSDYDFEGGYSSKWNTTGPEAYVHFADGKVQGYGLPKAKELSK